MSVHWLVEQHQALNAGVRAALLAQYGYTAPAGDTYGALISIIETLPTTTTCLVTFPFTFVIADYASRTGDLEAAIDAACRARLLTLRNAAPLASILGRKHPL